MNDAIQLRRRQGGLTPSPASRRIQVRGRGSGRAGRRLLGGRARLAKDESGASAVEYALLCALLALGLVGGLDKTGRKLEKGFEAISEVLSPDDAPPAKKPKKPKKPK